jgi:hypothetical protein
MKQKFHLGDVLSLTGEKLGSPDKIGGVYKLANFMTHDNLMTHQLIRAHKVCGPALLEQFPQLRDVDDSNVNAENVWDWLKEQTAKYGEYLEVEPLAEGRWTYRDPIAEAEELVGKDRVIVVKS